jgi:hypothetical protein
MSLYSQGTARRSLIDTVTFRAISQLATVAGFAVMVISGSLLFYAIPVRTFQNIFFRVKVAMLLLAGLNVWVFHSNIYRTVAAWDLDPVPPKRARVAGGLSLAFWACIVVAGRMIAYDWFD